MFIESDISEEEEVKEPVLQPPEKEIEIEQVETVNKTVDSSVEQSKKQRTTYHCYKRYTSRFFSTTKYFFTKDSETLMVAKTNGNEDEPIFINNGTEIKLSSETHDFCIISKGSRTYELHKSKENGEIVAKIVVSVIREPINYGRFFNITLNYSRKRTSLVSMLPVKLHDDTYVLPFDKPGTKSSRKNAIFIDDHNKKSVFIRKINKIELEIEVPEDSKIEKEYLFMFGIVSFICPF